MPRTRRLTRAIDYTGNKGGECSKTERRAHALRVRGVCPYCNQPLPASFAIDHVVPQVFGGAKGAGNQVACCIPCNSSKQHKPLTEWAQGRGDTEMVARVRRVLRRKLPLKKARQLPLKKARQLRAAAESTAP